VFFVPQFPGGNKEKLPRRVPHDSRENTTLPYGSWSVTFPPFSFTTLRSYRDVPPYNSVTQDKSTFFIYPNRVCPFPKASSTIQLKFESWSRCPIKEINLRTIRSRRILKIDTGNSILNVRPIKKKWITNWNTAGDQNLFCR
jgi:hypothetical protein